MEEFLEQCEQSAEPMTMDCRVSRASDIEGFSLTVWPGDTGAIAKQRIFQQQHLLWPEKRPEHARGEGCAAFRSMRRP